MNIRLIWLACWLTVALGAKSATPEAADTLRIQFRLRQSEVDPAYAGNAQRMEIFMEHLRQRIDTEEQCASPTAAATELCIRIFAGASPEGPAALNRRLGERRGKAIREALMDRLMMEGLDQHVGYVVVVNEGARWQQLEQMIDRSSEPWRQEALSVLRMQVYDNDEWQLDGRERELRSLHQGMVWQQLMDNYMPQLRSVGSAVLMRVPRMARTAQRQGGVRDTLVIRDTVYYMPYGAHMAHLPQIARKVRRPKAPLRQGRAFGLKTNLLLMGTSTPNLSAEWWLGRRWSMQLEGAWSWWTIRQGAYANQVVYGGMELRHYLGNRQKHSTIDGWYFSLGGGAGYYDLEWRSRGCQGEAALGYLGLGWQHRFGKQRQWIIDMGIGGGVLATRYKEYKGSSLFPEGKEEPTDSHLMWQKDGRLTWPGCTHANISIGYCFGK